MKSDWKATRSWFVNSLTHYIASPKDHGLSSGRLGLALEVLFAESSRVSEIRHCGCDPVSLVGIIAESHFFSKKIDGLLIRDTQDMFLGR